MLPDAEVGGETPPWWVWVLFLFILLFGLPVAFWGASWLVVGYLNLIAFLMGSLPWPTL